MSDAARPRTAKAADSGSKGPPLKCARASGPEARYASAVTTADPSVSQRQLTRSMNTKASRVPAN